jgi:hypothetical protein
MRRNGLILVLVLVAASASANTYTVTTTADSGAGSFRQAILDANANAGPDTIAFNIAGSGVQTISLASALAPLTSPVTIDGYTQPGASPNTQPFGQGLNTVLRIQVTAAPAVGTCFAVQTSDTTIKGLVVNGCTTSVDIQSGSSYVPPPCNGDFADVACPGNPFADWIEQLAAEGITGGCGGGNYCPAQAVRRDQMAAFLYNTFQFP